MDELNEKTEAAEKRAEVAEDKVWVFFYLFKI